MGKAPDPTKNIKEDEREKEREEGRFGKRFGGRVALEGQPPRPCSARGNETILEESDTRSDGRNHGKSDARRPASGTDRTAPEDDVGTRTENQVILQPGWWLTSPCSEEPLEPETYSG